MKQSIHTFIKGMNTDLDNSLVSQGMYRHASNFRLGDYTFADSGNIGSLENVKGNIKLLNNPIDPGIIVGHTYVKDWIVLFTKHSNYDAVWKISTGLNGGGLEAILDHQLVYSDLNSISKLNFPNTYSITAIGRKETEDLVKVYWVDTVNPIRSLDLNEGYLSPQVEANLLEIIPPYNITSPSILGIAEGGNYTSGVVQYSYQLYNRNGASTAFSPLSESIKLSSKAQDIEGGSEINVNTGKSVRIQIILPSTGMSYDRIRIVSVHYKTLNAIPDINIVSEQQVVPTLLFTDTGEFISTITLEEFISFAEADYIPKVIEEKENYLFAANILEKSFSSTAIDNWDSRTYRYRADGKAFVYEDAQLMAAGTYTIIETNGNWQRYNNGVPITQASGSNWSLPENSNAINAYNKLTPTSTEQFIYQTDLNTVGGEGRNVRYSFTTDLDYIDSTASDPIKIGIKKPSTLNFTSAWPTTVTVGGKSGEVYRIGIGFYNSKGQVSFIKWSGDIKFPEPRELTAGGGGTIFARKTLLRVDIKNFPQDPSIKGWQVFRVERKEQDRSILYSGVLSPTVFHNDIGARETFTRPFSRRIGSNYVGMYPLNYPIDGISPNSLGGVALTAPSHRLVEFINPEFSFFKPTLELTGLKLRVNRVIHRMGGNYISATSRNHPVSFSKLGTLDLLFTDKSTATTPIEIDFDIQDSRYVSPVHEVSKETVNIDGITYKNQIRVLGAPVAYTHGGRASGVILALDNGLYPTIASQTSGYVEAPEINTVGIMYLYGHIIRDVFETRYGGITYQSRVSNEYIPYSKYTPVTSNTISSIFGDNFITVFQLLRGLWWDTTENGRSIQESLAFPVESSIDLRFRLDELQKYLTDGSTWTQGSNLILTAMTPQETVEEGLRIQPDAYDPSIGDLYRYNSVYSTGPNVKKYYPKPFDFVESSANPVKIIVSEKKFNGEYSDAWTVFKPTNFLEVSTKYGEITALKSFNNSLIFWQNKAFGTVAVNERSLIQDNNMRALSLGTGGVLERYDYVTTELGCSNNKSIGNSDAAIYWYDVIKHALYEYSDRLKYLDVEKAVHSYLLKLPKSNEALVEVDTANKEVIFAFPNSPALVYSQLTENFIGDHTYTPYILLKDFYNKLYSVSSNKFDIYQHDSTNIERGRFYDVYSDSTVQLLINPEYGSVKVFDTVEFSSKSTNNLKIDLFQDTFTYLEAWNSYQYTGEYELITAGIPTLDSLSLSRKERNWTLALPRNAVNKNISNNADIFNPTNLDKGQEFKERLRDNYLVLKLRYDNSTGNYFSIPYVKINYRNSTR